MTRPSPRARRTLLAAGLLAVAALVATATPALATTSAAPSTTSASRPTATPPFAGPPDRLGHCQPVTVPVTLPTGQAAHLAGHLCTPAHGHPTTVMFLVHGATYNSAYWSWPQDPAQYSFVWRALAAGYAVLAIDRLGNGQSTRPFSALDTFAAQASTLHQTVLALRAGTLGHTRWQHVIAVGHSFGAAELAQELATWPTDADAVIFTGSGHAVSAATTGLTHTGFEAATGLESRFASLGLDPGYLTSTTQAVRDELLYDTSDSDPAVRAYDQASRDTLALTESTTRPADLIALTSGLRIPTLLLDGQNDSHYCDGAQTPAETGLDNCATAATLYGSEKPNYGSCFAASIVPGSGHDLTTELGAALAAALILRYDWATLPPTGHAAHCAVTGAFPCTDTDTATAAHRPGDAS